MHGNRNAPNISAPFPPKGCGKGCTVIGGVRQGESFRRKCLENREWRLSMRNGSIKLSGTCKLACYGLTHSWEY